MKILVTCHGFLTPSMTFIYNQINELENNGHEILVIANERLNEKIFPFDNVRIIEERKDFLYFISAIKRKLGIEYTFYSNSFSKRFEDIVAAYRPDVVHCHFGTHYFRLGNFIKIYNIPTVITFHGYDASLKLRDSVYCSQLEKAFGNDLLHGTAVSQAIKKNLVEVGIPQKKLIVDYLGVDTHFFTRTRPRVISSDRKLEFLQVSNFVEKKGHVYTLKAFKKYLDSTSRNDILTLGGAGPLYDEIFRLTQDLNLENNVVFEGLVDRYQVKELMDQADFFVHHSVTATNGDTEGLPTALMEAMAMELPCISTFHSGIPELITSGENGILTQERDIEAMSKAFVSIKDIPKNPREVVIENFSLSKNTKNIEQIFKSLLSE